MVFSLVIIKIRTLLFAFIAYRKGPDAMRRHVPGSAIASLAGYRMQLGKCDLTGKLKGKNLCLLFRSLCFPYACRAGFQRGEERTCQRASIN